MQDVCVRGGAAREEVLRRDIWIGWGEGGGQDGTEGKDVAEKRKDERREADRREISDSNVFRWTAARLVVLICHCNCGSMPLAGLQRGRKEKQRKEKKRKEKKRKDQSPV